MSENVDGFVTAAYLGTPHSSGIASLASGASYYAAGK
jgi:hypothetical protein